MEKKIYYIIFYREVISCYRVNKQYLPIKHYETFKKQPDIMYGTGYNFLDYCLTDSSNTEDVFLDKKKAIKEAKYRIKQHCYNKIEYAIETRKIELNNLPK